MGLMQRLHTGQEVRGPSAVLSSSRGSLLSARPGSSSVSLLCQGRERAGQNVALNPATSYMQL